MKVALIHDWLNGMRGGEKILEVLAEIFPDAHIYTLLYEPEKISSTINNLPVKTSFIQYMPKSKRYYRYYLPLFPLAVESFRLKDYDLVISTSHCVAKSVKVPKNAFHICYCFTPMRYVWDFSKEYFGTNSGFSLIKPILGCLKYWDRKTAKRPDCYFSISQNVASRIKRYYNRDSVVIYPPVDTDFFVPQDIDDDYYLMVSALVPYKRVDLAVKAFNILGLPLRIIGTGTEEHKLRKQARPNIQFLGWQDNSVVRDHYARCRAFVFPGIEDFGITILEAQSCGRPVIAFAAGGARETIDEVNNTGIFFKEQTPESLIDAVKHFEKIIKNFSKQKIRQQALKFDRNIFKQRLKDEIQRLYNIH